MKIKIRLIVGIFVFGSIMSACNSSSSEENGGHDEEYVDHEDEGNSEEGIVSLTKQQMDAIGLKIVQFERRNMAVGIQATGKLELAPQDRADISPVLGGIVKSVEVFEGDKVKKGQVLAVLEHPDFIQYQQDYINNLNTLNYLEKEYARQKRLYEEKVGSGRDFQKVNAEYQNSKATLAALKAKLKMLGLNPGEIEKGNIYTSVNLVSPMNGSVSLVETNVGTYIEPLSKVFEIVNNDKIHADLMVYEKDMANVKIGQKIFFTTSSQPGKEVEAEIYAISPVFEVNPKSMHVHAKILTKNTGLLPGMYIKGKIIADNIETQVLPEKAIVQENGKTYIFVKIEGEDVGHEEGKLRFEFTEVITGISSGGFIEIKLLKTLPDKSRIAGNGAYYLLAEMSKGETEHGH